MPAKSGSLFALHTHTQALFYKYRFLSKEQIIKKPAQAYAKNRGTDRSSQ